jgi:DNA replication protein DnaC
LPDLFRHFRLLTDSAGLSEEERAFLQRFLVHEHDLREQKKREYLLRMSGLRKVRLLSDFDWTFNPKIPRERIMEFILIDGRIKVYQEWRSKSVPPWR